MSSVQVAAQAKINLRLKVMALGDTGFHYIETVFQRLALADLVTVSVSDGGGIELDVSGDDSLVTASGPAGENLALLAARAYLQRANWRPRVEIRVEKVIPVGAGLGGGSADAAAVLRAMNDLAPAPLPAADVLSLAATLGSDVPFLASAHPLAVGWGRGERLMSLPSLPARPVILAIPPVHVSTREAYGWLEREPGEAPGPPVIAAGGFASWEQAARQAENDFSEAVAHRHPVINRIRESLLERGARIAMLTGSGSAVFGIFDSEPADAGGAVDGEWREIRTATAAHVVPLERMD